MYISKLLKFDELHKLFEAKFGIPADKQVISVPNFQDHAVIIEDASKNGDAEISSCRQLVDNVIIWVEPTLEADEKIQENGSASATSSDEVVSRALQHSKFLKNRITIRFNNPDKTTYDHSVQVKRTDTLGALKEHIASVCNRYFVWMFGLAQVVLN